MTHAGEFHAYPIGSRSHYPVDIMNVLRLKKGQMPPPPRQARKVSSAQEIQPDMDHEEASQDARFTAPPTLLPATVSGPIDFEENQPVLALPADKAIQRGGIEKANKKKRKKKRDDGEVMSPVAVAIVEAAEVAGERTKKPRKRTQDGDP